MAELSKKEYVGLNCSIKLAWARTVVEDIIHKLHTVSCVLQQ
jgi:hypothetical protein